ncbi:MAG: MMPL family transporter [Pseudomonadota bacterium]
MAIETTVKRWRWLAGLWAVIVLLVAVHQVHFWRAARLDTDVMALLPENEQAPQVGEAMRHLSDQAARQVVVLVGAQDWQAAQQTAQAVQQVLAQEDAVLTPQVSDAAAREAAVAFYAPWRDRLLTAGQRAWLTQAEPDGIAASALLQLYQPTGGGRITDWPHDPLGLWAGWWAARAAETRVRPRDGLLWLEADGFQWVLLRYERRGAVFSMTGETAVNDALAQALTAAVRTAPGSRLLATGVPLYAEVAAAQSNREMTLIGYGSLAAVLLLVWLTFRSLRPIVLVGLSLVIGCAVALSATAWLFGKVHLLTLVFGASLVGVAEDYGFHYFAARQGQPASARWRTLRSLLPGLLLALATSAVAYLALGLAPFPGLRQMAVFSAVGLSAAFLTVLCWFPLFDRGALPVTRFASRFADTLQHWPYWRASRGGLALALVLAALTITGLLRLESHDDLRQLQSLPAGLVAQQQEANRLLGLPSPAQFYLVEGRDAEEVLRREEALTERLANLMQQGRLEGYRAVSDWVPSAARQQADAVLTQRAERVALDAAAAELGETVQRPAYSAEVLTVERALAHPSASAIKAQWIEGAQGRFGSLVLLSGVTAAQLPALEQAGRDLPGVRWVDKTAEFSGLLARYRVGMAALLLAGYAGVLLALYARFRRAAWRALLPTALGSLITLAVFGWIGLPLQLFTVLALVLLLGMGVDYGIFLLEHPGEGTAWLAVALAGVSTLLSFGLLALSSTPALHAFGLTMLLGEVLIWLLTPFFRLRPGRDAAISTQNA